MRPETHPHRKVARLAGEQHGVVARPQLVASGLGAEAIKARLATGALVQLHAGVYAVGHRALPPRAHLVAAVLAAGDATVVSHRSAAALWGLRAWSGDVEVTVPHGTGARRRADGVLVHQTRRLPADEVTVVDAIPVTGAARTLLDIAGVIRAHELRRAVERADQVGLFDLREVERLLAAHPRRKGRRALAALLEDAARHDLPVTRSDLEAAFLQLCLDHSLPRPQVNRYDNVREVDFRWPAKRLVVEVDGWATHGTREAFGRDRARDRALLREGWRVARFTWPDVLRTPEQVAADVRALLHT